MGDCAAAVEGVVFAGDTEVVVAVVFRDPFELVARDGDAVLVDVVGEQVCAFLELARLEFFDPVVASVRLSGERFSMCFRVCYLVLCLVDTLLELAEAFTVVRTLLLGGITILLERLALLLEVGNPVVLCGNRLLEGVDMFGQRLQLVEEFPNWCVRVVQGGRDTREGGVTHWPPPPLVPALSHRRAGLWRAGGGGRWW